MEDYLQYKTFRIIESITEEKMDELVMEFNSTQGIDKFNCVGQKVSFIYNPYEISKKELVEKLAILGLTIRLSNRKTFRQTLTKMADDNNKSFGRKRLDCCGLSD